MERALFHSSWRTKNDEDDVQDVQKKNDGKELKTNLQQCNPHKTSMVNVYYFSQSLETDVDTEQNSARNFTRYRWGFQAIDARTQKVVHK